MRDPLVWLELFLSLRTLLSLREEFLVAFCYGITKTGNIEFIIIIMFRKD